MIGFEMIGFWQDVPHPNVQPIGAEWSAECARVHAESFAHPWPEADFEGLLAAREVFATGAIETGTMKLVGFVLSRFSAGEADILTIAVTPRQRRRGIGATLLDGNLAGLTAKGVTQVFLEVDADNGGARALYARFGFRQVGLRKAYYRPKDKAGGSALLLRADLD